MDSPESKSEEWPEDPADPADSGRPEGPNDEEHILKPDPLAPEPEQGYEETPDTENADDHQNRIAELEAALLQTKDQMLRAVAEAENTRKRLLREREDVRKFAISDFARDLLDFADNFRRALDSIPADLQQVDERISNVITGVQAMEKELLKTLEKHGIQKIEPVDQPFNPNFHEAMFEAPGTGKPAGTIVEIIEPGYILNERLLRPARVGIAKDDGQGNSDSHHIDQEV